MRSPTLLLIRMKAAETSASSAIADWTPLTVVSRSSTTAEIDTFIIDVSTTSTNIAMASKMASRGLPAASVGALALTVASMESSPDTLPGFAADAIRIHDEPELTRKPSDDPGRRYRRLTSIATTSSSFPASRQSGFFTPLRDP